MKELMQAFGATGSTIGLLSATYFYAYAGFMIQAGVLLDRLGVRWVVAGGGLDRSFRGHPGRRRTAAPFRHARQDALG